MHSNQYMCELIMNFLLKHACLWVVSNRFVPPVSAQSGEIEMKSNIGYLKSAGIGTLPPTEEVEHIYEELPYEEPTATKHERGEEKDHDYVNDPQGEAYKQAIDEAVLVMRDDDGYYVNDDLFPEEYRVTGGDAAAAQEMTVKKTDNISVDDQSNWTRGRS